MLEVIIGLLLGLWCVYILFSMVFGLKVLYCEIDLYLIVNELLVWVYDMLGFYLDLNVIINVEIGLLWYCLDWYKDC